MVAMSDTFRARWERDRERREIEELEQFAALLIVLWNEARGRS
jgi:hypothetical protein